MSRRRIGRLLRVVLVALVYCAPAALVGSDLGESLAPQVTIYRDEWSVPHIEGPTDASVSFGFAYAQAEDYFWQVEDTYIASLGRASEVYGAKGIDADLLNRSFEIGDKPRPTTLTWSRNFRPSVKPIPRA